MNFQVNWAVIEPFLSQLLQSPQFKGIVDQIWSDLVAKIASGLHPTVATQQARGQVAAAALLHLTGNPIADFSALLAGLKPPTDLPPAPPSTGQYKS
jgi:K+-transporting ATPase c subunit